MTRHPSMFRRSMCAAVSLSALVVSACSSAGSAPTAMSREQGDADRRSSDVTVRATEQPSTLPATLPATTPTTVSIENQGRAALNRVLDDLRSQPAMNYRFSVLHKGKRIGTIRLTVSDRLVVADGRLFEQDFELRRVGPTLFVRAGARYWESLGVRKYAAQQYDGQWALSAGRDLPFNLSRGLEPSALADQLTDTFDRDDVSVKVHTGDDGARLYRLTDEGGRRVEVPESGVPKFVDRDVIWEDDDLTFFRLDFGDLGVEDATLDDLQRLARAPSLGADRAALLNLDDPSLNLQMSNKSVRCAGAACTASSTVNAKVVYEKLSDRAWFDVGAITLDATISVSGPGTGSPCPPQRVTIPAEGASAPLACTVPFVRPPQGRTARTIRIVARFRVKGIATYSVNVERLGDYLNDELEELKDIYEDTQG